MKARAIEVKTAMNRLANAYSAPKDPAGTLAEFERVLIEGIGVTAAELADAVSRYIARVDKSYGFPSPASIKYEVLDRRRPEPYCETGQREDVDVREAWEKAGVDMDELKRLNGAVQARRKGI